MSAWRPTLVLLLALRATAALADDAASSTPPVHALQLEERPEPLVPKHPRTERQSDQLKAVALYGTGRLLLERGQTHQALRRFQRAARYAADPTLDLKRAILFADRLDRTSEAATYARLLAERNPSDPDAVFLAMLDYRRRDEPARALAIYEKSLVHEFGEEVSLPWLHLHGLAGEMYLAAERYPAAAEALNKRHKVIEHPDRFELSESQIKRLMGNEEDYWGELAEARLRAGDVAGARSAFAAVQSAVPDEARRLYNEARLLFAERKPADALASLQTYFDRKLLSQRDKPYDLLGEVLAALDRQQEWTPMLRQAASADPENSALGHYLARRLAEAGRRDEAARLFEKHLARDPQRVAFDELVEIYRQEKRPEDLLRVLAASLTDSKDLFLAKEVLKDLAQDAPLVQQIAEFARARHAEDARSLSLRERLAVANLAVAAGQFEAVGEFYELAIRTEKTEAGPLMADWGEDLYFAERYEDAAKVFRRALARDDTAAFHATYHDYLAGIEASQENFDAAITAAEKAHSLEPESPLYASRRAAILSAAGRRDEAIAAYAKLIERHESRYDEPLIRILLRAARIDLSSHYLEVGNLALAEEMLEQILDEFPDDVHVLNDLAYLWADRGLHLRRTLRMARQAVAAEPENAAYRDTLGWVLFHLDRHQEAIAELEKAAGESPDGVILDHLGDAYEKAGRLDEAVATWHRAAAAFDPEKDADKIKAVRDKLQR